jgi:tetratricopeptide (TPR) repeat protein
MNGRVSQLEFVNREKELASLAGLLPPNCPSSSIVIIRSPSGFGKSRLTDQMLPRMLESGFCPTVVDPNIRTKSADIQVYDGYFLQRAAFDLSARNSASGVYADLRTFLKTRRWRTAKEKKIHDLIRDLPSVKSVYSIFLDYLQRLSGKGRYSAEQIIASDTRDAIRVCTEYVEYVANRAAIVFVIREAQHIDHESLRYLFQLNHAATRSYLLLEYTSEEGAFQRDHQKLILREIEGRNAHILDLAPLDQKSLGYLIKEHISSIRLTSDFYQRWDGNLRSVIELKYRLDTGQTIGTAEDIGDALAHLRRELVRHLDELSAEERLLLSIIAAHREAIDRTMLFTVAARVNPSVAHASLEHGLQNLISTHGFVAYRELRFCLQNEDVEAAFGSHQVSRGFLAIAEKSLRDYYVDLIERRDFTAAPMSMALRQALSLAGKTNDVTTLIRLTERLTDEIRLANDQSIYVNLVLETISAHTDIFPGEQSRLVDWAAGVAYEAGDFGKAAELIETLPDHDLFQQSMLAFCYSETGQHDRAASIASSIRSSERTLDAALIADLIDLVVLRCLGDRPSASKLFRRIVSSNEYANSPNRGYALRFSEFIHDFPECTTYIAESVQWFASNGLYKSQAYSELAAAMHLSREGRIQEALALVDRAELRLKESVRDQHIILNNRAAVLMLANEPDFAFCGSLLNRAIRSARDDYSDLTILNNLAIANLGRARLDDAVDCAERALKILEAHDFGDRDIYWPTCFNASRIFERAGKRDRAAAIMTIPAKQSWRPISQENYWAYRYGTERRLESKYQFMARLDYHPLFLSHWMVDLEGLSLLRKAQPL